MNVVATELKKCSNLAIWLRWWNQAGQMLLRGAKLIEQERQMREQEQQLRRMAAKLRELNINPEDL